MAQQARVIATSAEAVVAAQVEEMKATTAALRRMGVPATFDRRANQYVTSYVMSATLQHPNGPVDSTARLRVDRRSGEATLTAEQKALGVQFKGVGHIRRVGVRTSVTWDATLDGISAPHYAAEIDRTLAALSRRAHRIERQSRGVA